MSATATANASGAVADAGTPKKKKGKLIIVLAAVLLLAGGGGAGGWYYLSQQKKAEGAHEPVHAEPKVPPTFLPIDSMVVNLADPSGDRMVQLGITVQLADAKSADQVKAYMPSIRSAILMLVSQRTSQELLQREGKARLATAIAREIARPLGIEPEPEPGEQVAAAGHAAPAKAAKAAGAAPKPVNPVQDVLFSSLIIQ